MTTITILVVLFLVVLFVLGYKVVFSKNDETKKSGGGGDTRKEDGRPLPPKNEKYKETN